MKRIGIICKTGRPEGITILRDFIPWLVKRGCEVFLDSESAALLQQRGYPRHEILTRAEAVVVLGGNGTMLGVARLIGDTGVPLLGVNLDGLGFITEINRDEIVDAVDKVLAGKCSIEERIMLNPLIYREGEPIADF